MQAIPPLADELYFDDIFPLLFEPDSCHSQTTDTFPEYTMFGQLFAAGNIGMDSAVPSMAVVSEADARDGGNPSMEEYQMMEKTPLGWTENEMMATYETSDVVIQDKNFTRNKMAAKSEMVAPSITLVRSETLILNESLNPIDTVSQSSKSTIPRSVSRKGSKKERPKSLSVRKY